jgi:hypothetical protein
VTIVEKREMALVVVPFYKQSLTPDEEISLRHLIRILGHHPLNFLSPESLPIDKKHSEFAVMRFPDRFFEDVASYSQLLLSRIFYETFRQYDYILIYQLDCLVFSDHLAHWCSLNYDYIGAPLFRSNTDPARGLSRTGNGGLSLRKVESFLKVLNSRRYVERSISFGRELLAAELCDTKEMPPIWRFIKKIQVLRQIRRGVQWYTTHYTLNEDIFWSDRARMFYPDFKIAPVEEALHFAFEKFPRCCFEQNGRRLPFGCHAWAKYDRVFWEPYLVR